MASVGRDGPGGTTVPGHGANPNTGTANSATDGTPRRRSGGGDLSSTNGVGVVVVGPDLNASRAPLDSKLYRHIALPNGLQALLIQDSIALHQQRQTTGGGGFYPNDDEDDEDGNDDDDDDDETEEGPPGPKRHNQRDAKSNPESEDDDNDDDEGEDSGGLRDAACCIVVGGGSVSDPASCPGLAHFLEHLLFMGSVKYPGENEYPSYIAKRGGTDAAYTEWEYTSYSFNIAAQEDLFRALDRLAQFFVAPLLLPNAVERELQSIEAEFQLQKNRDSTRRMQLLCSTSKPDHPICKFSWGNTQSIQTIPQSLGMDPMQELKHFYNQHYYAQNMRLVIQGAYTLDQLQQGVISCCSDIPAVPRDGSPPLAQWHAMQAAGLPFLPPSLATIARVVPVVRECHELCITWQIPSQIPNWRSKPVDFLSHLMGHEASGSLLSYGRAQSWATDCSAGGDSEGSHFATSHALFSVSFTLSEAGLPHWPDMVDAVYQYIGLLRQQCRDGWQSSFGYIYQELKRTRELAYRYGDEASPDDTVGDLAEQMAPYLCMPIERILDGSELLFEFDEQAVQSLLDEYMTPQLGRIDLLSSSFGKSTDFENSLPNDSTETIVSKLIIGDECNPDGSFDVSQAGNPQIDPMFGTQFWCQKLPAILLDQWTESSQPGPPDIASLGLPPPNPFVPHNLDLKLLPDSDADHPLMNASLKLCIPVGKTKQWFTATAVQYNLEKNSLLLSFEDEDEKWHTLDNAVSAFTPEVLLHSDTFEGSMDSRIIKFRIVALSLHPGAKGAGIRKFGDETDFDVDDGLSFPPIPPPSSRLPIQIANSNTLKMWWLQDRKFKRPVAEFRLQIICAKVNSSPLHRATADLLADLCADALLETSYMAEMCELDSSIEATDIGFNLRFSGYDDKLLDLFQTTLTLLLSFRNLTDSLPLQVQEDRFEACLEMLKRSYKNSGMSATKLSSSVRLQVLRPTLMSANKKLVALEDITIGMFCRTASDIWEAYSVEALLHGNADRSDANAAKDLLSGILETTGGAILPRKKYPAQSVLRIPAVDVSIPLLLPSRDPEEPNTACDVYIQVGKDNLRDRVMLDLLMHIINEPLFDQIRTKDQFGYDVYCDVRWSYGIIGCVFHVTTNSKSAVDVSSRIDSFLTQFRVDLIAMSKDDFQEQVVALAKQKLAMFDSLSDETGHLWGEIHDGRFEWEVWRDETICLRGLSKTDVLNAFDSWLRPGQRRNILTVQVIGAGDTDASLGRPLVESDHFHTHVDEQVAAFHQLCKLQTWGRVNSKLF